VTLNFNQTSSVLCGVEWLRCWLIWLTGSRTSRARRRSRRLWRARVLSVWRTTTTRRFLASCYVWSATTCWLTPSLYRAAATATVTTVSNSWSHVVLNSSCVAVVGRGYFGHVTVCHVLGCLTLIRMALKTGPVKVFLSWLMCVKNVCVGPNLHSGLTSLLYTGDKLECWNICVEGIRTALLESPDHRCPSCETPGQSPDVLIPNKYLRAMVTSFINETSYVSTRKPPVTQTTSAGTTMAAVKTEPLTSNVRQPSTELTARPPPVIQPATQIKSEQITTWPSLLAAAGTPLLASTLKTGENFVYQTSRYGTGQEGPAPGQLSYAQSLGMSVSGAVVSQSQSAPSLLSHKQTEWVHSWSLRWLLIVTYVIIVLGYTYEYQRW